MQYRSRMIWVHESESDPQESQDAEYIEQIIEILYTLLPVMRDLRKVALLRQERSVQGVQSTRNNNDRANLQFLSTSENDDKAHVLKQTPMAGFPDLNDLLPSLLCNLADLWKQTGCLADEAQVLPIAISTILTARLSSPAQARYNQTKARAQARSYYLDQRTRKQSFYLRSVSVSQQSSTAVDAGTQGSSQSNLDRYDQNAGRNRLHTQAALGAGAGAAVIAGARMLLARRARIPIRV
jgi:hypothetical protein